VLPSWGPLTIQLILKYRRHIIPFHVHSLFYHVSSRNVNCMKPGIKFPAACCKFRLLVFPGWTDTHTEISVKDSITFHFVECFELSLGKQQQLSLVTPASHATCKSHVPQHRTFFPCHCTVVITSRNNVPVVEPFHPMTPLLFGFLLTPEIRGHMFLDKCSDLQQKWS
jgi:hypothetical protein